MVMPVSSRVQERPLTGRRIVVTRPAADADRLAGRLRALGAEAIVLPAIRIEFTDPPELKQALATLEEYDWIVFTSRNAVEAAFRLVDRIKGPRIAAIGPATAAALEQHGTKVDLVPKQYVAEAVLDALGDVSGLRVLLPRADLARPDLTRGLEARGATVTAITAYRTVLLETDASQLHGVDAITFTSSSTVRGVLAAGPLPVHVKVVCIGPVTAATAAEYGIEITATAREYTEDGLVDAVLDAFNRTH